MMLLRNLTAGVRMPLGRLREALRRRAARWRVRPPVGWVRFGSFGRVHPISRAFGLDRGTPIDRYYVEKFLSEHAADIRGHVMEVGDDTYTRRFGGERVTHSDVLHVTLGNPQATLVGSLETGAGLGGREYDCLIITQTLHCNSHTARASGAGGGGSRLAAGYQPNQPLRRRALGGLLARDTPCREMPFR